MLVEDVRDSVADLVAIIKTYQSKGRLSQIMMSTLFKRRQEEAEAVIEAAVARLQVSEGTLCITGSQSTLPLVDLCQVT